MFKFLSIFLLFQKAFSNLSTVKELNLEKYEKRWYQVYGNKFDQTFQKYGNCITADYHIIPNGNVSVLNSEYSVTNKLEQITGYAYYSNDFDSRLNQGALKVHLDGVSHDSPYWVVNLGPVINYYYDWAIVTDPIKLSLFVLARDVNRFYIDYDTHVSEILDGYGYNNVINISHTNCSYVNE